MATGVRQIWQRMIGLVIVGYVDFVPRRNISLLLTSTCLAALLRNPSNKRTLYRHPRSGVITSLNRDRDRR